MPVLTFEYDTDRLAGEVVDAGENFPVFLNPNGDRIAWGHKLGVKWDSPEKKWLIFSLGNRSDLGVFFPENGRTFMPVKIRDWLGGVDNYTPWGEEEIIEYPDIQFDDDGESYLIADGQRHRIKGWSENGIPVI